MYCLNKDHFKVWMCGKRHQNLSVCVCVCGEEIEWRKGVREVEVISAKSCLGHQMPALGAVSNLSSKSTATSIK